jgi:hypothetical protein
MALPSSGQISISSSAYASSTQISFETSQSGKAIDYSLRRLSRGDSDRLNGGGGLLNGYAGINQNSTSKPDRNSQHSLAEFYSYNRTQNGSCSGTSFGDALSSISSDDRRSYNRISVSGNVGDVVIITVVCPNKAGSEPFGPFSYAYYNIYNTYPFDTFGSLVGSPLFSGYTSNTTNTHSYTLETTSDVLHIVAYSGLENIL